MSSKVLKGSETGKEKENPPFGLKTTSLMGTGEEFLDPADTRSPPAFTRLVSSFSNEKEFFATNLKVLLGTSNEYHSYIGGKCLCGTCICGNCKCVHFKRPAQSNLPTPTYKEDYVRHPLQKVKQRIQQPENVQFAFPFTDKSTYKLDYPGKSKLEEPQIMNRSKIDNLGPAALRLKAPFAGETSNQLHYPDWGTCKAGAFEPYVPTTGDSRLPFVGKPEAKEIGRYFTDGVQPDFCKAPNPTHQLGPSPLGPDLPRDFATNYARDFKPLPEGFKPGVEKKIPDDNLTIGQIPFDGNYDPTSTDFGKPKSPIVCPLAVEILRLKKTLREYAISNKIPF